MTTQNDLLEQPTPAVAATPQLTVALRPHGPHGKADFIDVSVTASIIDAAPGEAAFSIPLRVASIAACDIPASSVEASDQDGALRVTADDDAPDPSGFLHHRRYLFDRQTRGPVTLRYRVAGGDVAAPRRSGPPFDLICQDGGISGAGVTFLLTPLGETKWDTHLRWDLSALPDGTTAVSSMGDGNADYHGPLNDVQFSFFMVGKLSTIISAQPTAQALNAYWLGTSSFDTPAVLAWVAKLYPAMSQMLPSQADRPFRVLGRLSSISRSGGAALNHSFLIGYGNQPESESRIKFLLAHELAHPLAGTLGDNHVEHSWYAEGLAEFYKLIAPLRFGFVTDEEFLEEFAKSTRGYYPSRWINLPSAEVPGLFWKDTQAQRLPYARGLLYFVALNARVRGASGGARSLDDLVNEMQANARGGRPYNLATWRALVVRELGEAESDTLENMIAGATQVPPSDVFGKRFVRRQIAMPGIELGFEENSLNIGKIEGLKQGSAAAEAGLRDGDAVLSHNYAFRGVAAIEGPLKLRVEREGAEAFDIAFIPRGPDVTGYEWTLAVDTRS